MKCEITSRITHNVLISKEITYKGYKEICSGEPKKVNLGYKWKTWFQVENNSLVHIPRKLKHYIFGFLSSMGYEWELLSKFFSIQKIQPNWLDCKGSSGYFSEELGGWTGCLGQV